MPCDYKELGQIDETLMEPVKQVLEENNWAGKEYDRFEPTLLGGKLVVLPYLIIQPRQLQYTKEQLNLLKAVEPIIEEVMKQFPGYIKVRGELATLMPGSKIKLHSASNNGPVHRVHLILDLLDENLYNSIARNKDKLLEIRIPEEFKKQ